MRGRNIIQSLLRTNISVLSKTDSGGKKRCCKGHGREEGIRKSQRSQGQDIGHVLREGMDGDD